MSVTVNETIAGTASGSGGGGEAAANVATWRRFVVTHQDFMNTDNFVELFDLDLGEALVEVVTQIYDDFVSQTLTELKLNVGLAGEPQAYVADWLQANGTAAEDIPTYYAPSSPNPTIKFLSSKTVVVSLDYVENEDIDLDAGEIQVFIRTIKLLDLEVEEPSYLTP